MDCPPPAHRHLEGPGHHVGELAAPHVLDELPEGPGDLPLHPQGIVLVNILHIIVVIEVLRHLADVGQALVVGSQHHHNHHNHHHPLHHLYDGVHEAGVAEVGEAADPGLRLVARPAVPPVGPRAPAEVIPGAGSQGGGGAGQ